MGELRLTAKLLSQLEDPPMLIPFARTPRGKTSATKTHAPGYNLSEYDTSDVRNDMPYAPRIAKVDLIDPDKHNCNPASRLVVLPGGCITSVETGDNEVANAHSQRSSYQDWLSTKSVDIEHGRDGGCE